MSTTNTASRGSCGPAARGGYTVTSVSSSAIWLGSGKPVSVSGISLGGADEQQTDNTGNQHVDRTDRRHHAPDRKLSFRVPLRAKPVKATSQTPTEARVIRTEPVPRTAELAGV